MALSVMDSSSDQTFDGLKDALPKYWPQSVVVRVYVVRVSIIIIQIQYHNQK